MGNSGFNPRYPNYPKNPNNSPTQIFSLISAQSNKPSKFLNPSCRPPRPTTHPPPHPPAARGQHPPRPTPARRSGAHGRRSPPNHLSVSLSPTLSISPPDQEARTKSSGLGDCRSPCCGPPPVSASARRWPSHRRPRPRPRRSPRRRIAGRAAADPSPAGLCVPSQAAAAGRPG